MKTKLLLIASILLCGQNLLHSQETWQYLGGLSDQYLWKVYAQSPDTVYIAGASSSTGQGMIAKSTNGGINWTKTFTTTNNVLKDIVFYDKNTGFVVGEKGVILKTTNGGADWTLKTSGTTQNLNAIALVGLDKIWAVGNSGTVLNSSDGGETWQQKDFSTSVNLNDVKFYGSEGYIVGNNTSFYKTIDAGIIWNKEFVNINRNTLFGIQKTLNDSLYILAGGDSPYSLYIKNEYGNCTSFAHGNGFYMMNNGFGYSFYAGILTNGSENIIELFKIENNEVTDVTTILKSWSDQVDYHCSVSIAADTMLYVVTGNVCLKSSPNMTTDLKLHFENDKKLTIKNKLDGSLTLKTNNPAMSYQLINALGKISLSKNLNFPATDIDIPVQNIPKGVYILSVVFENNKTAVKKWIKH